MTLTAKEKLIHDQGLVTVLRQIHDGLDEAVLEAYGWGDLAVETQDGKTQDARKEEEKKDKGSAEHSSLVSCVLQSCISLEQELLTRLVALNHERAAEEKRGHIRWLRPEYQNPTKPSDGHPSSQSFDGTSRPPLQADLAGTDPAPSSSNQKSKINNPQSSINPSSSFQRPDRLPDQVAIIRKLIAG